MSENKKMEVSKSFIQKYTNVSLENVECPLCSDKNIKQNDFVIDKVGYPGIPVQNVICKNCGLVRINPRMSQRAYDEFYEKDFFEYLNPYNRPHYVNTIEKTTDENFKTEAEKHTIPFVYPYVKEGGKVLDIGAGFGNILFLLRKLKNAEIHGIEPDPFSRGLAKEKLGIDLSGKGVEDFLKFEINEGKKYDYVHLEQVFEHLLSPLQSLREIAQILNPQGVLYIGVPGQYNYTVAPDRFFELAHTYGYTPATLNKFAKQAGMKIIKVKDPMSSNLEVLMALENSIYFEEDRNRLAQGEIWWDTKNRLIYRIKYFKARAILKETIKKYLGENVNNFLRKIIS